MLPKISFPTYECTIPSLEKVIKYRPFLMKEYKALLQSIEFKDETSFISTISDILGACTLGKVDIEKLTMFDVDYLFLKIRSKSKSDSIPARYSCNNWVKDIDESETYGTNRYKQCNHTFSVNLNLNDIYVKRLKEYKEKKVIQISDTVSIKMISPTFKQFREINTADGTFDPLADYVYSCIECITDGQKILMPGIDFNQKDLLEFFEMLTADNIEKISNFFKELPIVALDVHLKCPKCKNESTTSVEGLNDFFV